MAGASFARADNTSETPGDVIQVSVDLHSTLVRSFFGLGIQWDPYAYPPRPEAWRSTLHRLDYAKPAFFRVMTEANSYCTGFNASGKPRYVWEQGEDAIRKRLGSLLAILDYAQSRKIDVILGEWAPPGPLGGGAGDTVGTPDDPRWAGLATDFVNWLRISRGYTVVRYYNLMNEPNGSWMWPDGKVDYKAWAKGIRGLRKEFDTHGLRNMSIVGPDNAWSWEWADEVSRDMPDVMGDWEMHWYATDREVLDGEIEKLLEAKRKVILANDPDAAEKWFFLAESGLIDGKCNGDQQPRVRTFPYGVMMADYVAQVAQAGWMGLSAWDMDDAMHTVTEHLPVPTERTLKLWGFWNTQGTAMGHPEDENIRPWFYSWSLMCRLFPRDTRIVGVSPTGLANFRVMAGEVDANHQLNVMLVNDSKATRSLRLAVPGQGRKTVLLYHYFENDRPTNAEGLATPSAILRETDLSAGLKLTLNGQGCVFVNIRESD
ncbi:MAG: hypothetical protein ABSE48_15935 [Verrucomicrobiota bacterium]